MSALLERLRAAFDTHPILLSDLPVHAAGPADLPQRLPELADTLAALANDFEGGVVVFGLDSRRPHRVRGVADAEAWALALERLADALIPPVPIDIEIGEDQGYPVLAAYVPYVPVVRGHVHRRGAPPCRVVDGRVEPWFPPLRESLERLSRRVMLTPVEGSTPLWVDPAAAGILGHPHPGAWSPATRTALREAGILAADGVRLTRAGVLLVGLPERRPEGATVIAEREGAVAELAQGWLLLGRALRDEARAARHAQPALVADLVLDVLVRTAPSVPKKPMAVDLTADLVTIEAPRLPHEDRTLTRLLARFTPWRGGSWRADAQRHGLVLAEERQGAGLFVQLRAPRVEPVAPKLAPAPVAKPATPPIPASEPAPHVALPSREAEVLALLADGQPWTRRDLDARLGWSRSTMRRVLEGLVRDGRVVNEVASPRSPHQAYRAA